MRKSMAENQLSDADISRGCRQDNPKAWRHLVRTYTPLVYRIAFRILKDQSAAEDAAQEVFMTAHRAIERHDPTRPLAPWLARITYNSCLKCLDKTKRRSARELDDEHKTLNAASRDKSPEDHVHQKQVAQHIDHALDRLSAQDRGIIVMRYREGFSDSEISQATRMPVGTVKTRLHRARGKLKKYLFPLFKELSQ
jgi:RNA polymerase sigma-70 factor (ECF subfamily)